MKRYFYILISFITILFWSCKTVRVDLQKDEKLYTQLFEILHDWNQGINRTDKNFFYLYHGLHLKNLTLKEVKGLLGKPNSEGKYKYNTYIYLSYELSESEELRKWNDTLRKHNEPYLLVPCSVLFSSKNNESKVTFEIVCP